MNFKVNGQGHSASVHTANCMLQDTSYIMFMAIVMFFHILCQFCYHLLLKLHEYIFLI